MNRDEYEKGKGKGKEKEKNANNAAEAAEARRNNPIEMKVTENGEKKTVEMEKKAENEKKDSSAQKPKGLWPGERMFASDLKYWFIACALWFLGLVLLSALLGKISALVIISYAIAFLAWLLLLCVRTIPENMRAKPVLFGVIGKKVSWGSTMVLAPFEKLILFPTGIQQINLTGKGKKDKKDEKDEEKKTGAGIQTEAGEIMVPGEDGKSVRKLVPSIMLPVAPVLNFRWPSNDDDLTESIKNAPPPDDLDALKDIIEEPTLDIVRTVGGKETYLWILRNRTELAGKVNKALKLTEKEARAFDNPNEDKETSNDLNKALAQLIHLTRIRNITVSFKHMNPDKELLKQQVEEAAAIYKGEAARIIKVKEGEASKRVKELEGEGTAYAEAKVRTAILDVLVSKKYEEVAVLLEKLKAFTAASQTGKTTVVVPSDILNMLGSSLGGSPEKKLGISQEQIGLIIAQAVNEYMKKKGE
ncbi:hypothetical protein KKE99_05015 [Patescibacteria group bacterium]|nr:hypothetical protein [Patescibacteria group bacterium]